MGPSRFFEHAGGQVLRIDIYLPYSKCAGAFQIFHPRLPVPKVRMEAS